MTSSANSRSSFRPDIEGLRGLAVLLVVLFHSRVPGFDGGFVGVDIFFALSGYLITGLIVAEVEQTGTFSFRNFYARRVRRLLPASGLAVVGILLFGFFIYSPLEMASYAKWAIYTSLYISNYMFMRDAANYFAADVETNPFLHTWSLAIEEQFYLFWPALIVLSLSWLKSRRRLAVVLCVICIASFIFCVWLTRVRQPWAFFSLPSRVWEFSLGGMACLLRNPQLAQRSSMLKWLAWGGLVAVLVAGSLYSPLTKFPGYTAALPVVGTIAILILGASGIPSSLGKLLSTRVLQYLGRLSYSWYLWHWPVLLFAAAWFPDITWRGRLVASGVALIIAQFTFSLLEHPVRTSSFLAVRPVLSLALALIVPAIGLTVARVTQGRSLASLRSSQQRGIWAASKDSRALFDSKCLTLAGGTRLAQCEFGDHESSSVIVLFGDSHAEHWFPAIQSIADEKRWRLVTLLKASCPVARVETYSVVLKREDKECSTWREAALQRIAELRPHVVILAEADVYVVNRGGVPTDRPLLSTERWEEGLQSTLSFLSTHGLRTLVIADVPRAEFDVPTCLSREAARRLGAKKCVLNRDSALNADARSAEAIAVREVPNSRLVDYVDTFCPDASCQLMIEGNVVYRDSNHLTSTFARSFAPSLTSEIDSLLSAAGNQTQSR